MSEGLARQLFELGVQRHREGATQEAIELYRQVLLQQPQWADAHANLGSLLRQSGSVDEGLKHLVQAAHLAPGQAAIWRNLGNAYRAHSQYGLAIEAYRRSLSIDPALETRLSLVASLQASGQLTAARDEIDRCVGRHPEGAEVWHVLGVLALEMGEHQRALDAFQHALSLAPDSVETRRSYLMALEYNPGVSDQARLAAAKEWGQWASERARRCANLLQRQKHAPSHPRKLRLGFVSADLCSHPVGLFLRPVLQALDSSRFEVFCYSHGGRDDNVRSELRKACYWRDITLLDDFAAAQRIVDDGIDVLFDLSGHTGQSRLTLFAWRPAALQISWIGYFATTGLATVDAVIMDPWHAPPEMDSQFTERILRLPNNRFCFAPLPFAPEVAEPPSLRGSVITFGSFNNTAKLNAEVIQAWSAILLGVPGSRLVLKWRTLADENYQQSLRARFAEQGVAPERLILRAAGAHYDLLKEYADIDIALDPFPFTGGLTSCEALWMGVPVITWPQSRVVSRQTHAFLHQIGLPELSAKDADDYVRIAVELANDRARLAQLRATLRERMRASPLMDVTGFTRQLEDTLIDLYRRIEAEERHKAMNARVLQRTILHVGPGHRNSGAKLPAAFQGSDWKEIRLDIDPANEPDIIGSMLDMAAVVDASVDAIYSAHNIEHVYAHEVPQVLKEFLRVLKPDGFLVVTCPDLQTVCQLVAEDKLGDAAYTSPAGPITPLDILYGHGAALAAGHLYMAHKTGFTLKTLTQALHTAGFATSAGKRRLRGLDLWVVASKGPMDEVALRELAGKVLPG